MKKALCIKSVNYFWDPYIHYLSEFRIYEYETVWGTNYQGLDEGVTYYKIKCKDKDRCLSAGNYSLLKQYLFLQRHEFNQAFIIWKDTAKKNPRLSKK